METLPPQPRAVVKMRRIEGLLPGDIAVRMGLSVSTVEKHLAKGLAMLAYAMQDAPPQEEGAQIARLWQRHRQQRK
jgi:RNA polymerase sigma-70 factor (ECF subfamily)